jgi:hypothetical protein
MEQSDGGHNEVNGGLRGVARLHLLHDLSIRRFRPPQQRENTAQ